MSQNPAGRNAGRELAMVVTAPPSSATSIRLTVNGAAHTVHVAPDTPLLYVLRDELHLQGPR